MHFEFNGTRIEGFRRFDPNLGFDDGKNTLIALQIEDTVELWETERLYKCSDDTARETIRLFLNWIAISGYCEPVHLIRWFVLDPRIGYNCSWRLPNTYLVFEH